MRQPFAPNASRVYVLLVLLASVYEALATRRGPTSTDRRRDNRDIWQVYDLIKEKASPHEGVTVPRFLRHLQQFFAPPPFDYVVATSAWLDQRPLWASKAPLISIIGTVSALETGGNEQLLSNELQCYVAASSRDTGSTSYFKLKSYVKATEDINRGFLEEAFSVKFSCALPNTDVDWAKYDIYTTLSLSDLPPPLDVFLKVQPIALPDKESYLRGDGPAAICMAPVRGDLYGPFMPEFIRYYETLGFSLFFPYLTNPGPSTLKALREFGVRQGVHTTRWGLSRSWQKEALHRQQYEGKYIVAPSEWMIPGISQLSDQDEATVGETSGDASLVIWYFGQSMAINDCAYRAMSKGARWVAVVDWDEYLALQTNSSTWPPQHSFSLYADELAQADHTAKGRPLSFVFRSTFVCITCEAPERPPFLTSTPSRNFAKASLEVPYILTSPVRESHWFWWGERSKVVLDPWAHWGIRVHYPGWSYREFTIDSDLCGDAGPCQADIDSTFGGRSLNVPLPDNTFSGAGGPGGGVFHMRHDAELSRTVSELRGSTRGGAEENPLLHRDLAAAWNQSGDKVVDWTVLYTLNAQVSDLISPHSSMSHFAWRTTAIVSLLVIVAAILRRRSASWWKIAESPGLPMGGYLRLPLAADAMGNFAGKPIG